MENKIFFNNLKATELIHINFISVITLLGVLYLSNACVSVGTGAMDALEKHIEKQQQKNNLSGDSNVNFPISDDR